MARKVKEKKPENLNSKITSALRKVWRYSDARREALARASVGCQKKHRRCEMCKKEVHEKLVEVDHINPMVSSTESNTWDAKIERLLCPSSQLRILCEQCHKQVTQQQREEKSAYKKSLKQPKTKPIKIKASNLFAPQPIQKALLVASEVIAIQKYI
jgi:hypothetical protein